MADIPEASEPNMNENDYHQLMENAPQKSCLTSSTPGSPSPAILSGISPAVIADSSGECLSLAQLRGFDINQLIESCDLKSDEITGLLAEEPPSSESDDTYGSCVSLSSETKDNHTILAEDTKLTISEITDNTKLDLDSKPQTKLDLDSKPQTKLDLDQILLAEDIRPTISEITGNSNLDLDSMQDWVEDPSEGSEELSSWKEPLIPEEDESDLEDFGNLKGYPEFLKLDDVNKESSENDLINLNESPEKILEPEPDQTTAGNISILDFAIESPLNQTALADESLVDIEVESATSQTDVSTALRAKDKNLSDIEIQPETNHTAVANKGLVDIEIQPETNHTAVANKDLMDIVVQPLSNKTAITNNSLLAFKTEVTSVEIFQDSIIDVKQVTRAHIELIRDILSLNSVFQEPKTHELPQTTSENAAASKKELESLESELRAEAELDSQKRRAARTIAEIGFPKVKIRDEDRIAKDDNFTEHRRKKIFIPTVTVDSVASELTKECYDLSGKIGEDPKEPVRGIDSEEYVDVVSLKEAGPSTESDEYVDVVSLTEPVHGTHPEEYVASLNDSTSQGDIEESTLENNIDPQGETNDSTEIDSSSKSLKDLEMLKKTLKKRVTFADRKGEPGVEHMAEHEAESAKKVETTHDIETSLRFLTESYPSHEDEEMLSESFSAVLEAPTLPRRRRGSPRVRRRAEDPQKLLEELQTLEEVEEANKLSVSQILPPQQLELADSTTVYNKTTTDKPNSKFSKFFKSFKKKIFN